MKITPFPFEIQFPIEIFKDKKVNFNNHNNKKRLFKRNMYYFLYHDKKNTLLEKRSKLFLDLALRVEEYIRNNYKNLRILSVSIFGSSLYSKNNDDYDFLIVVEGNKFENLDIALKIHNKKYPVGISIKGKENFVNGEISKNSSLSPELQKKIINRTSISLPIRHLPILGLDFKENKELFVNNCYAQTYDLLSNAYDLYYKKTEKKNISPKRRAQKILSRAFEASKYLAFVANSKKLENLRKEIFNKRNNHTKLKESKITFKKIVGYYNQKAKNKI